MLTRRDGLVGGRGVSADDVQVGQMEPCSSLSGILLGDVGSFVVPFVDVLEGRGGCSGRMERERETDR